MKGIARADSQQPADYEAAILALSRLSHAVVSEGTPNGAFAAAAETSAILLRADAAAVYLLDVSSSTLELAASYQLSASTRKSSVPAESIALECIENGVPVVASNLAQDRRKGVSQLARQGLSSILCVPLKAGDEHVGSLAVMTRTLRAFSPSDIAVLGAIADQAAFAAWKSKLGEAMVSAPPAQQADENQHTDRKIQELSIINQVSEAVISTLDLSELLNLALDRCLIAVGASVGSIMLVDERAGRLSIRVSKGLSKEVIASASVAIGEGISGWVARHAQPVLVHDAKTDPRFRAMRYREDITSAMSIPLKARGRVIGVLNASTIDAARRYGPREVEFLTTIANQVAVALDNARLYERLNRRSTELVSLLRMSEAITSTLDLRQVLETLSARFLGMAQVDVCAMLVYDADTGRFRCLDGKGLDPKKKKQAYLDLALPIASRMMEAGEPVWGEAGPGTQFGSETSVEEGLLAGLCAPLTAAGGRVVGAVALFSKALIEPSDGEIETLRALGGLAGVAVHNALIYQHKYDIARTFQFELVPKVPMMATGLEVGHKFLPAREVGGDYYDFIKVSPAKVGIVIADVSGSSVRAAMHTSMSKHVLRAYAVDNDSPADVVTRLNRIACEETHPEIFISLFYGIFDPGRHSLRYACAGHEPPLLIHPDGSYETLRADGLLVGVSPDIEYQEKDVELPAGSVLILFTDGVVDSPSVRGKFGVDQIAEMAAVDKLKPAQRMADNLFNRLVETAGSRMEDDVALVVLKVL